MKSASGDFSFTVFGPKGGLKGVMKLIFGFLFFFVGIIEMVSILVRPVALSLRLLATCLQERRSCRR